MIALTVGALKVLALVCMALGLIGAGLAFAEKQNRGKGTLKRRLWPEDNEEGR